MIESYHLGRGPEELERPGYSPCNVPVDLTKEQAGLVEELKQAILDRYPPRGS
jgi:hypothetical protein